MKSAPAFQKKGQSFLISILYCKVMKKFISWCIKYSFNLFLHKLKLIKIHKNWKTLFIFLHEKKRTLLKFLSLNPNEWFVAQLVVAQSKYRRSTGSNSVKGSSFVGLLEFISLKLVLSYCFDHKVPLLNFMSLLMRLVQSAN